MAKENLDALTGAAPAALGRTGAVRPEDGLLIGLHQRSSNIPSLAMTGMSYLRRAMVSALRAPGIRDRVDFEYLIAALAHGSGYERVASPGRSDRMIRHRAGYWANPGIPSVAR